MRKRYIDTYFWAILLCMNLVNKRFGKMIEKEPYIKEWTQELTINTNS